MNTGVINPPAPTFTLPSSLNVIEPPQGSTYTVYVPVTVNLPLNYTLTYQTVSGTAVAGTDFVKVNPGTVHINNASGTQATVQIPITIYGGPYEQPGGSATKSFTVQLVSVSNNGSGNAVSQSLLGTPGIVDDDQSATSDGPQDQHRQSSERLGRRLCQHHDLLAEQSRVHGGAICPGGRRCLFELQHVAKRQALQLGDDPHSVGRPHRQRHVPDSELQDSRQIRRPACLP